MKIYICDFRDSFTLNIMSVLKKKLDHTIDIIEFPHLKTFFESLINDNQKAIVILGPGPGHPDDYEHLHYSIRKLLKCEHILTLGICLGHQLIGKCLDLEITNCNHPIHGQAFEYVLSKKTQKFLQLPEKIIVQKYNSLCINGSDNNKNKLNHLGISFDANQEEIFILFQPNLISYQFHPESIGTYFPELFFKKATEFLL